MNAKIIETFLNMPEQERTSGKLAARLQAQGCSADAFIVREVLEEAVLADVDVEAIRTAGRTLRTLVDVFDTSELRLCELGRDDPGYDPLDYEFVENLMRGLLRRHPLQLDVLTEALARLLNSYMAHRARKLREYLLLRLGHPAGGMPSEPAAAESRKTEMDRERDKNNDDKLGTRATHDDAEQRRNMRPLTGDELSAIVDESIEEMSMWLKRLAPPGPRLH